MSLSSAQILARLGSGETIESLCQATGMSQQEFQAWWKRETTTRVPPAAGTRKAGVKSPVRIQRDERGIPHVFAENDEAAIAEAN